MPFASIVSADYKIALFLHVLAVVLALGPTFGYGIAFSVLPQYPRSAPGILAGIQKIDRYLVNPGMIVILLAGIYMMIASDGVWKGDEAFIIVGFLTIFTLFGLQHAFFQPRIRKSLEMVERDLKAGDALSEEFQTYGQQTGQVGGIAGLIVVVTIFFMTYQPFL